MKVLSDFDGVLTDLTEEADRVYSLFESRLADWGGIGQEKAQSLLAQAQEEMVASPTKHGWLDQGRITAYWNEDGFVRVNALAACLAQFLEKKHPVALAASWALLTKGFKDFRAVAQSAYTEMAKETASGQHQPADPATKTVFSRLLEQGHEVVIVSNSGTDRILQILGRIDLRPTPHTTDPKARFRVRGGANKFILGNSPRLMPWGDYPIDTDRPHYETILREEKPDAVIGDVFSLDLALPLFLAKQRERKQPLRLFLRKRPYTPQWSLKEFSSHNSREVKCDVLGQLDELMAIV